MDTKLPSEQMLTRIESLEQTIKANRGILLDLRNQLQVPITYNGITKPIKDIPEDQMVSVLAKLIATEDATYKAQKALSVPYALYTNNGLSVMSITNLFRLSITNNALTAETIKAVDEFNNLIVHLTPEQKIDRILNNKPVTKVAYF